MKKALLLVVFIMLALPAAAQLEIGASYELRDEDPKSGFGARIQGPILKGLPLINLGLRLHASYFSDQNSITDGSVTYDADFVNYDFGIAAYGGISLGLVEPYVGVGLGSETIELSSDDANNIDSEDSNIYWNSFAGAKVTILPLLKPFVEYRFSSTDLSVSNFDPNDKTGRIMFGVVLSF